MKSIELKAKFYDKLVIMEAHQNQIELIKKEIQGLNDEIAKAKANEEENELKKETLD